MFNYDNLFTKKEHLELLKDVDLKRMIVNAIKDKFVTVDKLITGTQYWSINSKGIWYKTYFYPWELVYDIVNAYHRSPQETKEKEATGKYSLTSSLFKTSAPTPPSNGVDQKKLLQLELEMGRLKEVIRQQSDLLDAHIAGNKESLPLIMKGLGLRKKTDRDSDGNRTVVVQLYYYSRLLGEVRV
jgi:hypothetical protein